ncbi:MAG TPA: type II toxin-antitoxin system VapC family toxin [Thermomicrobiales bacterium]
MTSLNQALTGIDIVGIDTALFIYLVEKNPRYIIHAREIFRRIDAGQLRAYTLVITLTEVLTHPKRSGNHQLEQGYLETLSDNQNLLLLDVTAASAASAADLRARHTLRTPDAIQIATALAAGCDVFLTNDRDQRRVDALRVSVLDELTLH